MSKVHSNMMRMADAICKCGKFLGPENFGRQLQAFATANPRIIMDNVAEIESDFLWDKHAQRAVPPYPRMWIEFVDVFGGRVAWTGVAVETTEGVAKNRPQPDCRWTVAFSIFMGSRDSGRYFWNSTGYVTIQYDKDGRYLPNGKSGLPIAESLVPYVDGAALTCAYGLSMMNHKSFRPVPYEHPRHAIRNAKREGLPLLSYRTIWVDCFEKLKKSGMNALPDSEFRDTRQHLVAGHWKHYHEEAPMFGRKGAHGWFWNDAHVRGNPQLGTAVKDYAIAAR